MDGLPPVLTSMLAQFVGVTSASAALTEFLPLFGQGTMRKRLAAVFWSMIFTMIFWLLGVVKLPELGVTSEQLSIGSVLGLQLLVLLVMALLSTAIAMFAHDKLFPGRNTPDSEEEP